MSRWPEISHNFSWRFLKYILMFSFSKIHFAALHLVSSRLISNIKCFRAKHGHFKSGKKFDQGRFNTELDFSFKNVFFFIKVKGSY